ncbi:transmembrane protein, putative, partial [Bodo saltans]
WLDTGERITIDVPFEEIELCNRTDPVSLYVPPTLQLVGVDIEGPFVDTTGSIAVEVVVAAATVTAMLTGDPSSAASIQTLVVVAMAPCSQPTSKQTLSNLRALGPLPIGIDGYAGVVVGNLVITASVTLLQAVVVRGLLVSKRVKTALEACEVVRAPSMTIAAFFSFYQGTFYAASQLMARPGMDDGERGGGAVAFAFVFAAPFAVVWLCRTQLPRMCIAYEYQRSRLYYQLYAGPAAYVMLPQSRIEPAHLRRRFSTLVASYRKPHDLLPVLPVSIPFLVTLLALWNPESSDGCTVFFSLALVIHVAVCILVIMASPFRLRYDLPLVVLGFMVNGVLLVLSIVGLSNPRFMVSTVSFALLVLQVVLQVVKMMLRLWTTKLEELLQVPSQQLWSIGCGASSLRSSIHQFILEDEEELTGGTMVGLLTVGLLEEDNMDDENEMLKLDKEYWNDQEEEEMQDIPAAVEVEKTEEEVPIIMASPTEAELELLPVVGGCDVVQAPVGDSAEGAAISDLTQALETLERLDEEVRLRDELGLSNDATIITNNNPVSPVLQHMMMDADEDNDDEVRQV